MNASNKMTSGEKHHRLRNWFDALTDGMDDWRGPITAVVHDDHLETTLEAIAVFTATDATIERFHAEGAPTDYWTVKSVGYRAGPAGP